MPKQSSDIFNPGGFTIEFSKSGQKWTIEKGVDVGSTGSAIFSAFTGSTLVNKGYIYSYGGSGALFTKNNATLINKETGLIDGGQYGVFFVPDSPAGVKGSVENHGMILGLQAGIFSPLMGDLTVKNHGEIYGFLYGVYSAGSESGATSGPVIKNYNSIKSDSYGVLVATPNLSLRTKVVNQKDGVIKGSTIDQGGAAVFNPIGDMNLINKGKIVGDVWVTNSDESTVANTGKIKGDVHLGFGDDELDNTDGEVTKKIFGFDGNDKLTAGDAKDKFVFIGPINGTTNIDRVKNFESGKDKFFLAEGAFGDLTAGPLAKSAFRKGTEAKDADDRIIYDKDTGKLYLEDGVGGSAPIQFAKVDPGQTLKYSDFTVEVFV
ncbi:hypothetical protein [Bauldia sp.]|uniref:hypothetical protein n=1 Tax=Bauldia sp. TaxID=2575872 RepID=UPI003BA96002